MELLPWLVSAQYCARQGASAYLALWAFLLLLVGSAILARKTSRVLSRTFVAFAVLTAFLGTSIFYGCSVAAPAEQGLGTNLPAAIYSTLRCLGVEAFGTATGWIVFAVSCIATIVLLVSAIIHLKKTARVFGFAGSALLLMVTFVTGFLLFFGFSWCTSSRLF